MRRFSLALALSVAAFVAESGKAASPAASPALDVFPYGVSWYPELWPEDSWETDLKAMTSANISFVRIAEFSWSTLEPEEGHYNFAWLDRAIAKAKGAGLKIVIGTPTAAPPAWLTTKYPDTLLVEADGQRARHGGRRHFSVASSTYRAKAAMIAGKLAERYGRDPSVLGFQIDNEYGRDTFDPEMQLRFQTWLKAKYRTLAALNRAWYTDNWSVTYSDWAQIDLPRPHDFPGHVVDAKRFKSDMWRDYQQVQIDTMRPHLSKDKFITHNYVSKYSEFDFTVPAQKLDLVSWDFYSEGERLDPPEGALLSGLYRGFIGKNPWVMESSAGNIVFVDRNFTQQKGEVRAMAWQSIAHGADGYAFWVWKSPPGGNEQFHGSMLDVAGHKRPVFAEIAQVGAEIARVWPHLRGSVPVAEVAFLHDYPSRWALERLPMTKDYDPWKVQVDFYRAVAPAVGGIDVLSAPHNLARYRLVVAPTSHMLSAVDADALSTYVRAGGHLLIGPRAGVKNEFNLLWNTGAPGPLGPLLGARVDHTQVLGEPLTLSGPLGQAKANIWAERITSDAPGMEILLRYAARDGFLDGQPGVVSRRVGKGRVTYVGAWLDRPSLKLVTEWAATEAGTKPLLPGVPAEVEMAARTGPKGRVTVAINWDDDEQQFMLRAAQRDLIDGKTKTMVTLPKHGIAVLEDAE